MVSRLLVPPETPESVLKEMQQYLDSLYAAGVMTPRQGRKAEAATNVTPPIIPPYLSDETFASDSTPDSTAENPFWRCEYWLWSAEADENIFWRGLLRFRPSLSARRGEMSIARTNVSLVES